ncbi:nuclear transport factor 2 family protein [Roseobacter sinensis]|uniref:Nuclear transport factor 2 family protein n=1 Tax=Roseobacter sinensis TaxID=2931391 RepID=A0ABT3BJJ8_9RHOB|nr:nuclear transport factor 2 family protein [Roseobacter sp. WL0113]MCV3273750.1 nuclear transport factor 2 family protein [Roseobacter sp. WL0113]
MQADHANIDIIASIDTTDITANAELFHPDVVWHVFNPEAPELAGSYRGIDGIADFFHKVRAYGDGSFTIQPRAAWAVGDELVVVQSRNRLAQGDAEISFDVVVVWRITNGKVSEVWDIPAVQTAKAERATTEVSRD